MKTAAVVLAAGASTRLGEPKQNALLGSETLLARTIRVARQAGLDPVVVVVAAGVSAKFDPDVKVLINEEAAEGMASSIRIGVAAAAALHAEAIVILACDQPFVTASHLLELSRNGNEIVASAYGGRKGVPAHFPARAFEGLLQLRGDTGAREMLLEAKGVFLKKGELDVDTAEDLKRARELYACDPQL